MNKRLHVYYSGSVQGVGFRYTAERAATSLNLTGWVRNLADGCVEIVCEGREAYLKEFLERMENTFDSYIRGKHAEFSSATGEFDYFDIRF